MTPDQVRKSMLLLAQITAPAPEGDAWELAVGAWCVALAAATEADVVRAIQAHITDTRATSDTDYRPRGGWWPRPVDLLARVATDRPNSDESAWTSIRPHLAGLVTLDGLTPEQVAGYWSLPDSFTRRQMSTRDLDALRGRFLAGCDAARHRAANPTPAKVIPMRPEPPRLVVSEEQARVNRQAVAKLVAPPSKEEHTIPDERELRERAAAKVAQVRARFGGGR